MKEMKIITYVDSLSDTRVDHEASFNVKLSTIYTSKETVQV